MSVETIDINTLRWLMTRGYTEWDEYGSGHFQTVPDPPKPKPKTNKTKADLLIELAEAKEDIQAAVDRAKAEAATEIALLTKREAELKREFEAVNNRLNAALAEQGRLNRVIDNLRRDLAGIGDKPSNGGRFMLLELE